MGNKEKHYKKYNNGCRFRLLYTIKCYVWKKLYDELSENRKGEIGMCGKEFGKKTCKKIMAVVTIMAVAMSGNSLYFSNIVKEETEVVQVEAATEVNILDYESNTTATNFVVNDVAGMEKIMELANSFHRSKRQDHYLDERFGI